VVLVLFVAALLRIAALSDLPPGPHYDEAVNIIITRTIAFGGARPFPMVENFQGREVLYYYLAAPLLSLVHDGRFSLQLLGVFLNLLLVAATASLARSMFPGRRGAGIALAAGIVAAFSLPQVLLARQAFRAITLPTMQALALLLLWWGLRGARPRYLWLVLGGLVAGASIYTYNASRLFPVWLALGGGFLLLTSSGNRLARLRHGLAFFVPLAVVAIPFALYGLRNPDIFLGRLYEVTGGPEEITLWESLRLHARMFFLSGETILRYNPRGRPYFTPVESIFLIVGGVVSLWALWQSRRPALERTAYFMLLLSPLMILPSVISTSGFPPNHMRSIAMVPLIFILIGVGVHALLARLPERIGLYVLLVALIGGAAHTAQDYFAWARRADLYLEADADLAAAATWAEGQSADTIYIAAQDYNHPTVQVITSQDVRWLGTDTLFLPAANDAVVIFPRSAPPPPAFQDVLDAAATPIETVPDAPDNAPAFAAYALTADADLPLNAPATSIENNLLDLRGTFTEIAYPNGRFAATTAWYVKSQIPTGDLTPVVQMEDGLGNVIARAESFSIGSDQWVPGETLLRRVPGLRVPLGTPPGLYPLRWTWVARADETYLPYLEDGRQAGIWAQVGEVEVLRPQSFPPAADLEMDVRVERDIAPGLRLLGWDTPPQDARPGETLSLTLHWQGTESAEQARIPRAYTVRLGENQLALNAPTFDQNPPPGWLPGQLMTDRLTVIVPRDAASGAYPLRLIVGGEEVELTTLSIDGRPRQMEAPTVDTQLATDFGGQVILYGYTAATTDESFELRLVWRAVRPMTRDYTVFVHLVDTATGDIIAQQDQMPDANAYPTSLWLEGEFVEDVYRFETPTGPFDVRVGLYNAATGQRLLTADDDTFARLTLSAMAP